MNSGVASVDNWRGEYIGVHRPLKQSISKEINSAEHDIFASPVIDAGCATVIMNVFYENLPRVFCHVNAITYYIMYCMKRITKEAKYRNEFAKKCVGIRRCSRHSRCSRRSRCSGVPLWIPFHVLGDALMSMYAHVQLRKPIRF